MNGEPAALLQLITDNPGYAFWAFMWASMMASTGLVGLGQLFTTHTRVIGQPKDGPDEGDDGS